MTVENEELSRGLKLSNQGREDQSESEGLLNLVPVRFLTNK